MLREGTVFTGVCLSTGSEGGYPWYQVLSVFIFPQEGRVSESRVFGGGGRVVKVLCYLGGRYLEGRVSKWVGYPGGRVSRRVGYFSGRYASYRNAFMFVL